MRKCKKGWHLDDGRGYKGVCSDCILRIPHPTLRRTQRRINELLQDTGLGHRDRKMPYLPKGASVVSLRSRQVADYKQAASLLKDDLVWSGDFENIRFELLELIQASIDSDNFPENLTAIVQKLIAEENDLSI